MDDDISKVNQTLGYYIPIIISSFSYSFADLFFGLAHTHLNSTESFRTKDVLELLNTIELPRFKEIPIENRRSAVSPEKQMIPKVVPYNKIDEEYLSPIKYTRTEREDSPDNEIINTQIIGYMNANSDTIVS